MKACLIVLALVLGATVSNPLAAKELMLEGEIYAKVSSPIAPPSVPDMWQFVITQLAPEGMPVKKGQVILAFDAGELMKTMTEKQAALDEKQRNRERLQLEQAEKARLEDLAVEERRAARDKSLAKAAQPAHLIPGNEYQKLTADRGLAERQYQLALQRAKAAAEQRKQEWLENEAALRLVQSELHEAQTGLAKLQIKAPRDGVMVHRSSWNGEKFDVGSQVWMGLAVAEIPDPTQLAVRAMVNERDYRLLRANQNVDVVLDDGRSLKGSIEQLGLTVHSKSKQQPVPVVDVLVKLHPHQSKLKPGQVVRVRAPIQDASPQAVAGAKR